MKTQIKENDQQFAVREPQRLNKAWEPKIVQGGDQPWK